MTRTVFHTRNELENWKQALTEKHLEIKRLEICLRQQEENRDILKKQRIELDTQSIQPEKEKSLDLEACKEVLTLPCVLQQLILDQIPHEEEHNRLMPELHEIRKTLNRLEAEADQLRVSLDIQAIEHSLPALSDNKIRLEESIMQNDFALSNLRSRLSMLSQQLERIERERRLIEKEVTLMHGSRLIAISHEHSHFAGFNLSEEQANRLRIEQRFMQEEESRLRQRHMDLQNQLDALVNKQIESQNKLHHLRSRLQENPPFPSELFPESRLQQVSGEIHRLVAQKTAIENTLQPHINAIRASKMRYQEVQNQLEKAHRRADTLPKDRDLTALSEALLASRQRLSDHLETERTLNEHIAKCTSEINLLLAQKQAALSRLKALKNHAWMCEMHDSPERLVLRLSDEAKALVDAYDSSHPVGQSDNVRLCLAEVLRKSGLYTEATVVRGEKACDQYWQLCGMLWDLHDLLLDAASRPLKERIEQLMEAHPVDPSEARTRWQAFLYDSPQWRTLSLSQLLQQEENIWLSACNRFSDTLKKIPDHAPNAWRKHRRNGEALLAAVREHKQKEPGERKYLVTVLDQSRQLTLTPGNSALQEQYKTLISHNRRGKGSLFRLTGGAMLMLLGTAQIIASLSLHVLSFGLAAPLTIAGMAMGGSVLAGGAGLFSSGLQKGMAKKLANFKASATTLKDQSYEAVAIPDTCPFEPSCPDEEILPPPYDNTPAAEDEAWYPTLSPGQFSVNRI